MQLNNLRDQALHQQLKALAGQERELLTKILHHLKEVERRKLFSDFGCSSLFDYATKELGYSEGQAYRRIQAMRLMRELPELEQKIQSGKLNLSNISKAQSFFKELKRSGGSKQGVSTHTKLEVLTELENQSTRQAQKQLFAMNPQAALPKEKERIVAEDKTELRFVVDDATREKLEQVRSLLGPQGSSLGYAELINSMADLCVQSLSEKRFGKKRVQKDKKEAKTVTVFAELAREKQVDEPPREKQVAKTVTSQVAELARERKVAKPLNQKRYIAKRTKHEVWQRDKGRCCHCKTKQGLQYDHIHPLALGGETTARNLRILCFHCNQRAAMQVFGVEHIVKMRNTPRNTVV